MAIAVIVLFVFIVVSSLTYGRDTAAGNAVATALQAIQKPIVSAWDWFGSRIAEGLTDGGLRAENESMKAEIERLEDELTKTRLDASALDALRQLRDAYSVELPHGEYTLKAADILAYEGSDVFNVFTIGVGTEDGVSIDTVVVTGGGLAGRVFEANALSSKVVAIIDESNRVGFAVEGNSAELGICYGSDGGLAGEMLDDQADIHVGDRVITSGLGGIYPAGLVIGIVTKAEFVKESSRLHVDIDPSVDFKGIKKVVLLL